ncbi:uncharacterized protein (DUF736 family) [Novosphingobium sp. PhB57]|nr:uncharacterized protein (DUF736 family) [Novosphingobium sp. PhB57]
MNIGEFQLRNGRLMGSIATRTIDLPHLGLRPVESQNDRAPIYEIVALNVGNRWVQIGALWEAVARNSTGEAFLQGSIDDPSLSEPLPIALFGTEQEGPCSPDVPCRDRPSVVGAARHAHLGQAHRIRHCGSRLPRRAAAAAHRGAGTERTDRALLRGAGLGRPRPDLERTRRDPYPYSGDDPCHDGAG